MRFMHISDLHIGKKMKEASLEEDQRYILRQILDVASDIRPDGLIIAGDVYDTTSPTTDSFRILDWFLTSLSDMEVPVFMIAGNHDPPEKLGFGSRLMERSGIHVSAVFSGRMDVFTVSKDGTEIDVCMLPFIKPAHVRRIYPDEEISSYTDAVASAISHTDLAPGRRRILVTHQFVVSGSDRPDRSESESVFVGGTESVDSWVFDGFDYVALGHIHKPQAIGRDTIRYCGTPLKYSLSEAGDRKSITVVDIGGSVTVSEIPLKPLRDVRKVKGPLEGIIEAGRSDPGKDDFIYAELDSDAMDALPRLREVYPNLMSIEVAGRKDSWDAPEREIEDVSLNPLEAFAEFYRFRTGRDPSDAEVEIIREALQ